MICFRCTLRELYEAIMTMFPYYRRPETRRSWQNSVRHSLSFNDCFVKVPATRRNETSRKTSSGSGMKGGYWTLHPEARRMFDHGCFLRRSQRFRCLQQNESPQTPNRPALSDNPDVIRDNIEPRALLTMTSGNTEIKEKHSSPTVTSSTDSKHFNHPFSISTLMRNVNP